MKTVSEGTIEIRYEIREDTSPQAGNDRFDWILSNGDDSFALFESAEEAEADIRDRF